MTARAGVEAAARAERAAVLATVARDVGDLALAEDAVQEALAAALAQWPRQGTPERPGAWLTTVARRAALRELRRRPRVLADEEALERLEAPAEAAPALPDGRLELLFACCHPALELDAQVALTLRTVAGLTTGEIARAFLVPEPTLAQRLVRAQRKLRNSGIPFAVPEPERMAERLAAVLGVIYLVFTEGHAATSGAERVRTDLCDEAVRLARIVAALLPGEPEALGLAALVLAHDARRAARVDAAGHSVPLDEQDRSLYDRAKIAEAQGLLDRALLARRSGPYQVQAAIACLHASAPTAADTDWRQIAALYAALAVLSPSPVIELNRAAAIGMAEGPLAGLTHADEVRARHPELDGFHLLHATRAELLRRAGRPEEAAAAYERALALAPLEGTARADLTHRLANLTGDCPPEQLRRRGRP
jgi:RNA polymerase sigma-70 factor (ECF subfamily)